MSAAEPTFTAPETDAIEAIRKALDDYAETRHRCGSHLYNATTAAARDALLLQLEEAQQKAARYEYVRKLNPRQYAELWQAALTSSTPFDSMVDSAILAQQGGKQ